MEQGSNAWNDWRDEGLGSSDAPVVMQTKDAYKTKFKLFQEKKKLLPPPTEKELKAKQFIFDKGHRIEEMVRERYERRDLVSYKAALFERADHKWAKASVDLCDHENKRIKEVKYVSLEEFEAGNCPERYYPQIQWQYICTDETWTIDLVLATDYMWVEGAKVKIPSKEGFRTKEVPVPLDVEYCKILFGEMISFWEYNILKNIPPELSDKDSVPLKDKNLHKLLRRYAQIEKKLDKVAPLEKERKALIDAIFKHEEVKSPIHSFQKMRIKLVATKGSIEYKNIPAVKDMKPEDLEKFRGATTFKRSILCS